MRENITGIVEAEVALFVHGRHYINSIGVTGDLSDVPHCIGMISKQTLKKLAWREGHQDRFVSFEASRQEQPSFLPLSPGTDTLRPYGLSSGQFTAPKDFDEPLPEELLVTPNPYVIVPSRVKNEALLALLNSWDHATEEKIEAQRTTWTEIKTALDAERATGRKIFAED